MGGISNVQTPTIKTAEQANTKDSDEKLCERVLTDKGICQNMPSLVRNRRQ